MSAIFGFCHFDGKPVNRTVLEQMGRILAHRGADGVGLWSEKNVCLGHRMLWTTPESLSEHLPLRNEESNTIITADARLDNREELIASLPLRNGKAADSTDAELILAAYNRWGEGCLQRLLGDFSFVIWDPRRQTFFCARDPLGVKHLYYHHSAGRVFAFASELKAILCLAEVPKRLNEQTIADHLLPFYEDRVSTPYQDIVRLPAAHFLVVNQSGLRLEQYWMPDLSRELHLRSQEDYAEAFREVFQKAVRCRLRSAFPVAAMLSGGLDSSSIACVASDELARDGRGPLHTFSGIFPSVAEVSPKIDERAYAEAVVAKGGIEPHFVRVDDFSPLRDLKKILWHLDNSLPATNMYLDWAIFKEAQKHGVRVLFSGNDGDSVVSFGTDDFREYARRGQWFSLMREATSLARRSKKPYRMFKKLVWRDGFRTLVPESAKHYWRLLHGRAMTADIPALPSYCTSSLINQQFADRLSLTDRVSELQDQSYPPQRTTREHHWNCISSGMDHFLLESFEKTGGAFSLEMRYPFFDRRVVEFCLALPPGQRLRSGWTRWILRRSMEGILPPKVQWRVGKADMSANFKLKLLEHEKETLDRVILKSSDILAPYVDIQKLRQAYAKFLANPMLCQSESFHIALVVNLSEWLTNTSPNFGSIATEAGTSTIDPYDLSPTADAPEFAAAMSH
jgi:asparagine synthase (glutamine-hydrolysing)